MPQCKVRGATDPDRGRLHAGQTMAHDHEDDGVGMPKILNIMQRENPRCLFICLELLRPRFLTVSKGGQGHR